EIDVIAAGARVGGGQLGVTEGADEGEEAADRPHGQGRLRAPDEAEDARRRLVDAGTDDDADDDADHVPQAEQGRRLIRGFVHAATPSVGRGAGGAPPAGTPSPRGE